MSSVVISGDSSGSITLAAPAVAGTNTLTLPAQTATVITDSSAVLNIGSGQIYKDASGNVGIGTSAPSSKLNLQGSSLNWTTYSVSGTNKAFIGVDNGTPEIIVGATNGDMVIRAQQSMLFGGSGGSYYGKFDTSGNLKIGTTGDYAVANERLTVIGGAASTFYKSGAAATVYIGNASTNVNLIGFLNAGNSIGSITNTASAVAYNTSSDYRLKENVQPMTMGLATISALKPVTYDWIIDKSAGEGFIAHELQDVIPLAVTGEKDAVNEDGSIKPQGVDYSKIVVHLVAAIQEQQSIISDLQTRIAALEAK